MNIENHIMTIEEVKSFVTDGKVVGDFIKDPIIASQAPFPSSIVDGTVYYSTGDKENTHKMIEHEDGTFHVEKIV
jgi:hypothetical protein